MVAKTKTVKSPGGVSGDVALFAPLEDWEAHALDEAEERTPPLPVAHYSGLLPLCDAYAEDAVLIWYRLVPEDQGDLAPEPCGTNWVGGTPKWWRDPDDDLSMILDPGSSRDTYEGYSFNCAWMTWALENGLAPGQPFLMRIQAPLWTKCSYEYDEWDCEWSSDVVRRMPNSFARARASWSLALARIQAYRRAFVQRYEAHRALQDDAVTAYALRPYVYGGRVRLALCSEFGLTGVRKRTPKQMAEMASAEGEGYQEAFRNLIHVLREKRPGVSIPKVLELAKGEARVTRWEHLLEDDYGGLAV